MRKPIPTQITRKIQYDLKHETWKVNIAVTKDKPSSVPAALTQPSIGLAKEGVSLPINTICLSIYCSIHYVQQASTKYGIETF